MNLYQCTITRTYKTVQLFNLPIYIKQYSENGYKRKWFGGLYKVKSTADGKKYYICGIRVRNKEYSIPASAPKNIIPKQVSVQPVPPKPVTPKPAPKKPVYDYKNAFVMEYFVSQQNEKYKNNPLDIKKLIENSKSVMISCSYNYLQHSHAWMQYLFKGELHTIDTLPEDNKDADLYVLLGGIGQTPAQIMVLVEAMSVNKPCLILESSFIRSINTFCEDKEDPHYRYDVGFVLDYLTAYYDATKTSYLENMLNDKKLVITKAQKARAKKCIEKIVATHLTKYNCQPIYTPKIGRDGVKKILVVDQSFGDNSIKKGLASVKNFEDMLQAAIDENPDADIIVKTHPDTHTGNRSGYYSHLTEKDNIFLCTEPINPISLIQYVDKVYVCTTQLGFEAVMCGKETHVFGMPFYAGWGVTKDRQTCERRTNKRSLEEIFYITYILYSFYVNPDTQSHCEIEEAMEYLLTMRDEYFRIKNIRNDLSKL